MQLDTITIDRATARKAAADYRRALKQRHSEEDEEMLRAYRAAAKGLTLIRLTDTLRAGGLAAMEIPRTRWDSTTVTITVPRLAVARADVPFVWTEGVRQDGGLRLQYERGMLAERETRKRFDVGSGTFDIDESRRTDWSASRVRALVPAIPPALRPAHGLHNYHLLWEAEWEIDRTVAPGDPALLKHVGGDLYAVLAVWDLTPLEQAVLAGRTPSDR